MNWQPRPTLIGLKPQPEVLCDSPITELISGIKVYSLLGFRVYNLLLGFRAWGLGSGVSCADDNIPIIRNQMERSMEDEMASHETFICTVIYGSCELIV